MEQDEGPGSGQNPTQKSRRNRARSWELERRREGPVLSAWQRSGEPRSREQSSREGPQLRAQPRPQQLRRRRNRVQQPRGPEGFGPSVQKKPGSPRQLQAQPGGEREPSLSACHGSSKPGADRSQGWCKGAPGSPELENAATQLSLLLLLLLLGGSARAARGHERGQGPQQPFEMLYNRGVEAFSAGDFQAAVRYLEQALSSRRRLREERLRCRLECGARAPLRTARGGGPAWELRFLRALLERARCVRRCERADEDSGCGEHCAAASARVLSRSPEDVSLDFQKRMPYSYLQQAYSQTNQMEKAAEAAYTFLMANPEHMAVPSHDENTETVAGTKLVDREAQPHLEHYRDAVEFYEADNFQSAIESFEQALKEYFVADRECRVLCEWSQSYGDYDNLAKTDGFYEVIAGLYSQRLICEHDCVRELATWPGQLSPIENFLPLHFDYLQFSYYQVGNYVKALECARAYLLFHPDDEDVQDNVKYYESVLEESMDPQTIKPREDATIFMKRHRLESELITSAVVHLGIPYTEQNYWTHGGGRQEEPQVLSEMGSRMTEAPEQSVGKQPVPRLERDLREGGPLLYSHVKFVYNSEQLNGTQRMLLDNVLSEEECRELQSMTSRIMLAGSGYQGEVSPLTPNEKFEGATILRALKFGYEGRVPLKSARLFYDVSEKARKIVQSYFMLNSTLYFSFTHLVCRTPLSGSKHQLGHFFLPVCFPNGFYQPQNRDDLSHPIHADNCFLDSDTNECWKEFPLAARDYSAILYMNEDFEGGEFIFTSMDSQTVTASIKPKCGRMVSFSSGRENPHGVKAVTKGQRCAVALWFTLDPLYRELERLQADEMIRQWNHEQGINPKDEL
uniref:procollagen-proline 3-dioxygenase n=1 Tax=Phascolarctos cinereus TaxID=38626 RepID=A0A6P5IND0_PHACI|nr:prolyl 3-hydroxylase 2 [Phascolarctos cinereus]